MSTVLDDTRQHSSAEDGSAVPADKFAMTLVVVADKPSDYLRRHLEDLANATRRYSTEIIVSCENVWIDPPPGVRVAVSGPGSRGDRLDRACEEAQGELLAFIDQDASLPNGWQARAIQLMADPTVGAVGGPELLAPQATESERAAFSLLSSRWASGPLSLRYQARPTQWVKHLPSTNLVVRRRAFLAAGGFQCPSPVGEDTRLCYKLRELLALRVLYDSGLAIERPIPALPNPFLSVIFQWGRGRGDLTRRLKETSRWFPYGLPATALVVAVLVAILAPFIPSARLVVVIGVLGYAVLGLVLLSERGDLKSGLLSAAILPLFHIAYAAGFWRGYLGRSLGEATPGRFREKPLRVLIFERRDITHPLAGGAHEYMHELARRWARAGCDVGWLSARYRSAKRVEVIDGIRFHRVGGQLTVFALAPLMYILRLRSRYDVIIDCETGLPFFTPLFSRKPRVLVVHMLHSELYRRELPRALRWFALWLEGWLMRRVYRRTSVVTVSPSTRADLVAHGYDSQRITIVANGVNLPDGTTAERSRFPLLLYLGRLRPYKSVDVLLRAMPRILSGVPDARLAIVGQGPDRERLERLAWGLGLSKSVRFYGYVTSAQRDELMSRAWVAVCPSALEGWGLVCLEANSFGTPVVAARVGGLRDSVVDGLTGILVPHGDSESLAQEVIALLRDDERRRSMGQAAFAWAKEHSWDRSAETFLETVLNISPQGLGGDRVTRTRVKDPAITS